MSWEVLRWAPEKPPLAPEVRSLWPQVCVEGCLSGHCRPPLAHSFRALRQALCVCVSGGEAELKTALFWRVPAVWVGRAETHA